MSRRSNSLTAILAAAFTLCLAVHPAAAGKPPKPTPTPAPAADPHIAFAMSPTIYVCNEDGQRVTPVYSAESGVVVFPSLSPTRDSVVFVRAGTGIVRVDFAVVNGNVVAGSPSVLYGNGAYPRWSPDGGRILFVNWGEDQNTFISVMPATGLQPGEAPVTAYLSPAGCYSHDSNWNASGDGILFTEYLNGVPGTSVIKALRLDADGHPLGEPEVVFADPRFGDDIKGVAAARTSNSVAFSSSGYVYTLDLDTGTVALACQGDSPVWSPDDSQLLYGYAPPPKYTRIRLRKVTLATGVVTEFLDGRQPDWK